MKAKSFNKDQWNNAINSLMGSYSVMAPVKVGQNTLFKTIENADQADFSAKKSRLSVKQAVFPQSERMFEYTLKDDSPEKGVLKESEKNYSPKAIVGIRPCDGYAFKLVEVNFDTPDYKDPWWIKQYEATTTIGIGCNEPCETCFCTSVNSGPFDEKGLDVLVYDLGDSYLAKAVTDKGEAVLETMSGGIEASEEMLAEAEVLKGNTTVKSSMPTDRLKGQNAKELHEAPFWEDLAVGCINCGACTFACPTCWCFDIQDELRQGEGDRIRNWDSCMFPLFTLHASGHNPRGTKTHRVRQRFMHKLKYYPDTYGMGVMCVGCGRCVEVCPVNIDIRQVAEVMNKYTK